MNIYLNNYTKLILCLPRKGNSMGPEAASSTLGLSRDFPSWMSCTQHLQQKFLSGSLANDYSSSPRPDICPFYYTLQAATASRQTLASRAGPGTECLSLTFRSLQIGASEWQTQNLGKDTLHRAFPLPPHQPEMFWVCLVTLVCHEAI